MMHSRLRGVSGSLHPIAFVAVLNVLSNAFGGKGLQIVHEDGVALHYLDVALLWRPALHLSRRQGLFPSWPWTGWIGAVEYFETISLAKRTIARITWTDGSNADWKAELFVFIALPR